MDEELQFLVSRLPEKCMDVSEEQITGILNQARQEALAEVKEILKQKMVYTILEKVWAFDRRSSSHLLNEEIPLVQELPQSDGQSLSSITNSLSSEEPDPLLQEEIQVIRRKIAENERLLSEIKTAPSQLVETTSTSNDPSKVSVSASDGDGRGPHEGYYVYAIVGNDRIPTNDNLVPGLPDQGMDETHPVYAIPYQAVQAIVSQVSLQEFGQESLKANLNNPHWLETKVRAHQAVLEAVSTGGSIIPMKFCTIYLHEDGVQKMIAQYYLDFVDTLTRLKGKQEWGVKVYSDQEELSRQVEETCEKVKALKTDLGNKPSGTAYFAQKKLDEVIAAEIERIGDAYSQDSHDRLAARAEESHVNPLLAKEVTGRKEEMVLNGAYLVAEDNMEAFRAELDTLENEYGSYGYSYELTGPWPPYNFVTIGMDEMVADE